MAKATASNHDVNQWIEQLKKCEYIKENEVKALCIRAKEILTEEHNVIVVESPVTVSFQIFRPSVYSRLDLWRHPWSVL